jgi:hypothetical protein
MIESPTQKKRSYRYVNALKAVIKAPETQRHKLNTKEYNQENRRSSLPPGNIAPFLISQTEKDDSYQILAERYSVIEAKYESEIVEINERWQREVETISHAVEEISGVAVQLKEERDEAISHKDEVAAELEEVLSIAMEIKSENEEVFII